MKAQLLLLILGASIFSCDPKPIRSRSIPLQVLEKETVTIVDTTSNDNVDKVIEE